MAVLPGPRGAEREGVDGAVRADADPRPFGGVAVANQFGERVEVEVVDHPTEPGLEEAAHPNTEEVVLEDPTGCGRVLEHGVQRERHARAGLACWTAARLELGRPVELT